MVLPFRRKNTPVEGEQVPDDSEILEIVDQIEEELTANRNAEQEAVESDHDSELTQKLNASAKTVTRICMDIRRNENVLIICDPTTSEIGAALHEAALTLSDRVLLMMMPKGKHHGDEPPTPVTNLMRQQNVIIAPTKYSITHTKAARNALNERARIATMPGITTKLFTEGGITANFESIKDEISQKAIALRRKRFISVRHENGTDLSFEVGWRDWNQDDFDKLLYDNAFEPSEVINYKMKDNRHFKYCNHCKIYKMPRMHHCSHCNACCVKYDHHCGVVMNCIGVNNYHLFV